jgi:hypothetical protein
LLQQIGYSNFSTNLGVITLEFMHKVQEITVLISDILSHINHIKMLPKHKFHILPSVYMFWDILNIFGYSVVIGNTKIQAGADRKETSRYGVTSCSSAITPC